MKIFQCPECGRRQNRQPPKKLEKKFHLEKSDERADEWGKLYQTDLRKSRVPPIKYLFELSKSCEA